MTRSSRSFRRGDANRPLLLGVAAMLVVIAGSYMPWLSVSGVSLVAGNRWDGRITLFMAVAGLVATLVGTRLLGRPRITRRSRLAVSGIGAVVTVLTTSGDLNQFAGYGLYLTLAGGLAWAFALIWEFNEGRRL